MKSIDAYLFIRIGGEMMNENTSLKQVVQSYKETSNENEEKHELQIDEVEKQKSEAIKELGSELNELIENKDRLEYKIRALEAENRRLTNDYDILANSKLGKLTLTYWHLKNNRDKISLKMIIETIKKHRKNVLLITFNGYKIKGQLNNGDLSGSLITIENELKKFPDEYTLLNFKQLCQDKLDILENNTYLEENMYKRPLEKCNFDGKVLHIFNTSIPYLNNGYSIRSSYIIENQIEMGLKPAVVTRPGFPNDFGKFMLDIDKEIIKECVEGVEYYRLTPSLFLRDTPTKQYIDTFIKNICNIIDNEEPNIVQAASNYTIGLAGLKAARIKGKPFVYEIRGFWEMTTVSKYPDYENSEEYKMSQKIETFIARNADKVIVISNGLKNELVSRGIDEDKITIIPNGVDIDKFQIKDKNRNIINKYQLSNSFVIGYIGSIVKYEGIQTVIKSIRILKDKGYKNIKYLIVGEGKYKDALKDVVKALNLKENVLFVDRIPHDKVIEYYSVFDLCVYYREYEKVTNLVTPLKPLEAMACSKVVIGSNLDAIKEMIIDGVNGFIVEGQEEELANKIEYIYNNYESIKTIGQDAREWVVENRSWENLTKKYLDVYNI